MREMARDSGDTVIKAGGGIRSNMVICWPINEGFGKCNLSFLNLSLIKDEMKHGNTGFAKCHC